MSYMSAIGPCVCCKRLFEFNPQLVPSVVLAVDGQREPVCKDCMRAVNIKREARGLPPHPILAGAYEAQEVP